MRNKIRSLLMRFRSEISTDDLIKLGLTEEMKQEMKDKLEKSKFGYVV